MKGGEVMKREKEKEKDRWVWREGYGKRGETKGTYSVLEPT